jgi:hypothetical protein
MGGSKKKHENGRLVMNVMLLLAAYVSCGMAFASCFVGQHAGNNFRSLSHGGVHWVHQGSHAFNSRMKKRPHYWSPVSPLDATPVAKVITSASDNDDNIKGTEKLSDNVETKRSNSIVATSLETKSNATAVNPARFVPEYLRQTETDMKGIGGQGGVIYDVNKVKRNLVQEAVKAYKLELLYLLATPSLELLLQEQKEAEEKDRNTKLLPSTAAYLRSDDYSTLELVIEEKLAALVRNNPVSTTTDSNLLEGTWEAAYIANDASSVLSWRPSFFSDRSIVKRDESDASLKQKYSSGQSMSPFQSIARSYYLENLDADQTAYVLDSKRRLGGLLMVSERMYKVTRLTRTSLELTLTRSSRRIFSSMFNLERDWTEEGTEELTSLASMEGGYMAGSATGSNSKRPTVLDVQILYLDSDLCVCVENVRDPTDPPKASTTNGEGEGYEGKLVVYTKSQVWTGRKERFNRTKRFLAVLPKFLQSVRSPYNVRRRIGNFVRKYASESTSKDSQKELFFYQKSTDRSSVKVLRLGESQGEEESSWEGDEDPFVELDAITRQEKMKLLSIAEIKEAGRVHKRLSQKMAQQVRNKKKKLRRPPKLDKK